MHVNTFSAVSISLFVFASLWLLVQALVPMGKIVEDEHGPRVTRLVLWRGLRAMAIWEAAVGLLLISIGSWVNCVGLFGMALLLWFIAGAKRKGLLD